MSHPRRSGQHSRGPQYGDQFSMGGLLNGFPIDLYGRSETFVWFNDFVQTSDYDATNDWTASDIGAPAAATSGIDNLAPGGQLVVNAGTTDSTGTQLEYTKVEFVTPTTDKWFAMAARFKVSVAAKSAFFVGLGPAMGATDFLTGATGAIAATNCIGWWKNMATANLALVGKRSSGSKAGSAGVTTMADDTFVSVGFVAQVGTISSDTLNGTIIPYIRAVGADGNPRWKQAAASFTTAIPNTTLSPVLAATNEAGDDCDVTVDYLWTAFER